MDTLGEIKKYINEDNIEKAVEMIIHHSAEFEQNSEFWNIKGVLCFKVGEYDIAIECLNKSVTIDDKNEDAYFNLSYVYDKISTLGKEDTRYEETNEAQGEGDIIIIKNTDNNIPPKPGDSVFSSRNNVLKALIGKTAPFLSICVLAYNREEKTKICVDSILKYVQGYDYELVLVDNGSTDGTLDFFKGIVHPRKKIIHITKNMGHAYGIHQCIANMNGEYVSILANDTYVTENWINNIMRCLLSDRSIAVACALSDNVSNLQSINLNFSNFEDMQKKAAEYNQSNPKLWNERIKLFAFGGIWRREVFDIVGTMDYGYFFDFIDDDWSIRIRRSGYKLILCKDTYVRHDHENARVGKTDDEHKTKSLDEGRLIFKDKYNGLDAWKDILNFEPEIISLINVEKRKGKIPNILGVDVRCGTPLLEIKNKLRLADVYDAQISAFTTEAKYYVDLHTVCNGEVVCDRAEYIHEYFDNIRFDYVVIGKPINLYLNPQSVVKALLNLLAPNGHLILKVRNCLGIHEFIAINGGDINLRRNICHNISPETIVGWVDTHRFKVNNSVIMELSNTDGVTMNKITESIKNMNLVKNEEDTLMRVLTNNFIMDITNEHNEVEE